MRIRKHIATTFLAALLIVCHTGAAPATGDLNDPADRVFDHAASKNEHLSKNLQWYFGGRSQRGWDIYVALIGSLIGTEADPDSREFAEEIHRWQAGNGLTPDGILDAETWMRMVATFQSQRMKFRQAAGELLQAPASDFYDPSRPDDLRYVDRTAYEAYKRMVRAARAEIGREWGADSEIWMKIISAYRSPEYQAELRRRSPNSGRAGLAMRSPHFTGRALDLYVGGEPVSTKDHNRRIQVSQPIYRWLVRNASRYGFYPYFYEPWHWEYRG